MLLLTVLESPKFGNILSSSSSSPSPGGVIGDQSPREAGRVSVRGLEMELEKADRPLPTVIPPIFEPRPREGRGDRELESRLMPLMLPLADDDRFSEDSK